MAALGALDFGVPVVEHRAAPWSGLRDQLQIRARKGFRHGSATMAQVRAAAAQAKATARKPRTPKHTVQHPEDTTSQPSSLMAARAGSG
jgi:hypothetical protein